MAANTDLPATQHDIITISDTDDFPKGRSRGIHCNTDGTAVLVIGGSAISYNLKAGATYPYAATRVNQTGTTLTAAGDLIWLGG